MTYKFSPLVKTKALILFLPMCLHKNVSLSWNVTLIDDDGHFYYSSSGRKIKKIYRPMIVKKNAGIQMNVVVPKGIIIGENSIVAANCVLRSDVPDNSLVYQKNETVVKAGFTTGFAIEN